jgi:hypothetical protein
MINYADLHGLKETFTGIRRTLWTADHPTVKSLTTQETATQKDADILFYRALQCRALQDSATSHIVLGI